MKKTRLLVLLGTLLVLGLFLVGCEESVEHTHTGLIEITIVNGDSTKSYYFEGANQDYPEYTYYNTGIVKDDARPTGARLEDTGWVYAPDSPINVGRWTWTVYEYSISDYPNPDGDFPATVASVALTSQSIVDGETLRMTFTF